MNTTYGELREQLLKLTKEQLNKELRLIALDECEVQKIVKKENGVIVNDLLVVVPEHDLYFVQNATCSGVSSFSIEELKAAQNADPTASFTLVQKKGDPFICVLKSAISKSK